MKLTRVDELIDPNTGGWDEPLVRDTFQEEEAEAILTIPNEEGMLNWLAWHFDSKGLFSVKSTYKLAVQISDNEARWTAGTLRRGAQRNFNALGTKYGS